MSFKILDCETSLIALYGRRNITKASREIDALRCKCGQADDHLTSLDYFLSWAAVRGERPAAFLMMRAGQLWGVALLSFRQKLGVPLGLVKAGNSCGQGAAIASSENRIAVMEVAARVLLSRPLAHTVILSLWTQQFAPNSRKAVAGVRGQWLFREARVRLDLSGGLEATMNRVGYKMRRNLRYYRRRAETDYGCQFLSDLDSEQRRQAVDALFDKGVFHGDARRGRQIHAALQATPGRFAMGLQGKDGEWLSYITGWRDSAGTHIDWQRSRDDYKGASLSTVMRAYLLEHEVERQSAAIHFVGGTSPFWSRVCEPSVYGDLFATRKGMFGDLAKRVICLASPSGQVAKMHAEAATWPQRWTAGATTSRPLREVGIDAVPGTR